jgi:hypothetical protein
MIDRVTVAEAAERLGVSQGAIRQRIFRGTIEHDKHPDGRVYVYLTPDDTKDSTVNNAVNHELVEELRDRIRFLEGELEDRKEESRRKDSIIMSFTQRIPELEPSSEPRESPENASESPGNVDSPEHEGRRTETRLPWWRRWFG